MKPVPVRAAKDIATVYGFDQVVVIARKVGSDPEPHGEHVTTYGIDETHCEVAAQMGMTLKYRIMGWPNNGADILPSERKAQKKLKKLTEDMEGLAELLENYVVKDQFIGPLHAAGQSFAYKDVAKALRRILGGKPSEAKDEEAPKENPDGWEANFRYLLERCKYTIRVREGGGPEDLLQSAVVTFMNMERKLEQK